MATVIDATDRFERERRAAEARRNMRARLDAVAAEVDALDAEEDR